MDRHTGSSRKGLRVWQFFLVWSSGRDALSEKS